MGNTSRAVNNPLSATSEGGCGCGKRVLLCVPRFPPPSKLRRESANPYASAVCIIAQRGVQSERRPRDFAVFPLFPQAFRQGFPPTFRKSPRRPRNIGEFAFRQEAGRFRVVRRRTLERHQVPFSRADEWISAGREARSTGDSEPRRAPGRPRRRARHSPPAAACCWPESRTGRKWRESW